MSIEAMKRALEAIQDLRGYRPDIDSAIETLRTALSQQPTTPEPVLYIHPSTFEMDNAHVGAWKPGHELPGYIPLFTHPAPDGLQWFTVAEDGLPEVGEVVIGGLWYTDPWLKPDRATSFMWGQCSIVAEKHPDFKEGKRWLTFGPAHSQITHWARFTPPAMLAAAQQPAQATQAEVTDEREAFEAEMRCEDVWGHRSLKKRADGRYENWQVDLMWDVWQARSKLTLPALRPAPMTVSLPNFEQAYALANAFEAQAKATRHDARYGLLQEIGRIEP